MMLHVPRAQAFQSTLPVWGGTVVAVVALFVAWHFNPPSPCGEGRLRLEYLFTDEETFQSTLPVWGGTVPSLVWLRMQIFQSTLPVWGGTRKVIGLTLPRLYFNPPSPCGEGP